MEFFSIIQENKRYTDIEDDELHLVDRDVYAIKYYDKCYYYISYSVLGDELNLHRFLFRYHGGGQFSMVWEDYDIDCLVRNNYYGNDEGLIKYLIDMRFFKSYEFDGHELTTKTPENNGRWCEFFDLLEDYMIRHNV